jgi:hypothetical protein
VSGGSLRLQQELRSGSQSRWTTASYRNPFTGVSTLLVVKGGQVTVDITATNRRMLSLELAPLQSTFDMLSVPGGEITVTQTYRYIDNTTETVPLGVFCVNTGSMTYKQDGQLSLTCPDRWWRVQSNGFGISRSSIASNTVWQETKRLVEGAWPNAAYPFPGWATLNQSATAKVGSLIWSDGNRDAAIQKLLTDNNLDIYFDANGLAVLRPIPVLTLNSLPVWTVNDGPNGTLKDATRQRDLTSVHNVIVLSTSASDVILPTIEVANTRNPAVDPLSSLGPLGRVVLNYSGNFRTTPQMRAAGVTLLNKQLSVQQQLESTSTSNPCLDGYDVLAMILPRGDLGTTRPYEQHLLSMATIPLMPEGEQQIAVRATRSTADDTV